MDTRQKGRAEKDLPFTILFFHTAASQENTYFMPFIFSSGGWVRINVDCKRTIVFMALPALLAPPAARHVSKSRRKNGKGDRTREIMIRFFVDKAYNDMIKC